MDSAAYFSSYLAFEDTRSLRPPPLLPLVGVTRSSIAQAAVSGLLLLVFAGSRILPRGPLWTRTFAREELWLAEPPRRRRCRAWGLSTLVLLLTSLLNLGLTIASAAAPPSNPFRWLQVAPWAASVLVTVLDRPRKTPKTLLALFVTGLAGTLASSVATQKLSGRTSILHIAGIAIALGGIGVILSMPLRDPDLPSAGIAGRGDGATVELRSPEDKLSLWGFMTVSWLAPLLRKGYQKQLNDHDVWLLPYEFQHSRLHMFFRDLQGSLVKRLMLANGLDLMIITALAFIDCAANLSSPLLLQRLLTSIKLGSAARSQSVGFAILMLLVRLISAQSGVFSLWYCRRAYERSRGEMITTIYAKTLTRKTQRFAPEANDPAPGGESGLDGDNGKQGRFARLVPSCCGGRKGGGSKPGSSKATAPATMGKILNLMRNDCYEVAQRFWEFGNFFVKPLQFGVSLFLLWLLVGWSCLFGVAWVCVVQLVNAGFVRQLLGREKLRRAATDSRLQATSQFVEAIRHLRWYDWQSRWLEKIMVARNHELYLRIITGLWGTAIATVNISAGALFPVASFFAYTYLAKRPLTIEIAFPAMQLFGMLETSLRELPDLITVLLNASIAVGRLESFLNEPDKEEAAATDSVEAIEFHNTSLAWPGMSSPVLRAINLHFSTGLSIVCGKVGAGKTALLQGILGELDRMGGEVVVPNEVVGYCAQAPWLQNMSIRENILFCAPFHADRYKQVLDACALTPDLAAFKHGDLTDIGEGGIGLSGGQKARVALARAVYSQARILLLDDPLAPLDHNTAESIVRKLFRGPLVEGRTVVLVTHRVDLCMHLADQVVEIESGTARVLDPEEVPRQLTTAAAGSLEDQTGGEEEEEEEEEEHAAPSAEQEDAAVPDKFIEEEHRRDGNVVTSVYWTYIKAGNVYWWGVLIALLASVRFGKLFSSWFLKAWGEAYQPITSHISSTQQGDSFGSGLFRSLPNPADDVGPWLIWYSGIGVVTTLLAALTQCTLILILYIAAKNLFIRVVTKVSNANFRFYDVTPVGRLMNRLTSDIGMLDGGVIGPLQHFALHSLTWAFCMGVIAVTTPAFFAFALVMTAAFVYFFLEFLPTSQSLRRLEMVSLSPLMSNFGILLEGLATIRAFKAQTHFQNRNIVIVDAFQKMDHFYWSLQAWLQYRFDVLAALSTFTLTAIALYQQLSPGLTAFVLVAAGQLVEATHLLCRQYGQLQMDFVSVERVVELLDLEEEASGAAQPPAAWPAYGDAVTFEAVTLRYAPHLEPSLAEATFTIPGGATCAVLGRTGSGKSTLALALLATLKPVAGRIRVGGLDLAGVDVHAWRQRVSFVAQDPVLFPGSLRQNLDPLGGHTDAECRAVLHRVLGPVWDLDDAVDAGGANLSQGQRQLVGIGRAVLRRSPVVVLDEATASIDKKTALAIQDVLRDELKQSTVITIAHRLEAVKDADYFIRLDKGRVVACGETNTA